MSNRIKQDHLLSWLPPQRHRRDGRETVRGDRRDLNHIPPNLSPKRVKMDKIFLLTFPASPSSAVPPITGARCVSVPCGSTTVTLALPFHALTATAAHAPDTDTSVIAVCRWGCRLHGAFLWTPGVVYAFSYTPGEVLSKKSQTRPSPLRTYVTIPNK